MLASRSRPREYEHHRRRSQSGSQKNRANQCTAAIRLDAGGVDTCINPWHPVVSVAAQQQYAQGGEHGDCRQKKA